MSHSDRCDDVNICLHEWQHTFQPFNYRLKEIRFVQIVKRVLDVNKA